MKAENDLNKNIEISSLFCGIGSSCENDRTQTFKIINQTIEAWLHGYGGPNAHLENSNDSNQSSCDLIPHDLIEQVVPDLLRFSLTAPYDDVRENFHNILISLKRKSLHLPEPRCDGPSYFIPSSEFDSFWFDNGMSDDINQMKALLRAYFDDWDRIENYLLVMSYHPVYLQKYIKMYYQLFRGDGGLPYSERFYLAILAASQMHSKELIYRFRTEFLDNGGDREWLEGLNKAPKRIHAIALMGQYLIHEPWNIEPKNISQLIHAPDGSFHITMCQLMQAVAIMSHVASLACFIFGCGITPELDHPGALTQTPLLFLSSSSSDIGAKKLSSEAVDGVNGSDHTLNININNNNNNNADDTRTKTLKDDSHIHLPNGVLVNNNNNNGNNNGNNGTRNPNSRQRCRSSSISGALVNSLSTDTSNSSNSLSEYQFNHLESGPISVSDDEKSSFDDYKSCQLQTLMDLIRQPLSNDELAAGEVKKMFANVEKENETIAKNPEHPSDVNEIIKRFLIDPNFGYTTFNSSENRVLDIQEYACVGQAFSLADRYYPEIGRDLEDKFNWSYEMTYNTMGDNIGIDTSQFRLSVWVYVRSLFGICHDDFNYAQLNNMLPKGLKYYIKKMATRPCTVKKSDFLRYYPDFKFSEKVHIALMIADARQNACLLHALKAMNLNKICS